MEGAVIGRVGLLAVPEGECDVEKQVEHEESSKGKQQLGRLAFLLHGVVEH